MQMGRLETNLTNVMLAELSPQAKPAPQAADSDDKYPLIEILRDAAFGPTTTDDAAITTRFHRVTKRGMAVAEPSPDATVPYPVHSAIYEKIDVSLADLGAPRTRKRHVTTRALLPRATPEPYELIEIKRASMSMTAVSSGSFEAAWFVAPDDAVDHEDETTAPARLWMLIVAVALIVAAGVVAFTI